MDKPKIGWCVDGSCIQGNPGICEYRGVDIGTNEIIFEYNIGKGTNNIAEFLGLVHAIALAEKNNNPVDIYSDSVTAIAWVRGMKARSTYNDSPEANKLMRRAEKWLMMNEYSNNIYKWQTKQWGEIPADFGRKG
jgi:ribonuclease HI